MELGLGGRTALVTGASKGIGAAVTRGLLDEGAAVVAVARGAEALEALRAGLDGSAAPLRTVVADVSTDDGVEQVLEAVGTTVDILVNNVGGGQARSVLELTPRTWQRTLDRNLRSTVALCSALVPPMRSHGWGRVVNLSSIEGRQPHPALAHYAAAKAAVMAYTKALSAEVAADGVLVNSLIPGLTRTEGLEAEMAAMAAARGASLSEIEGEVMASWGGPIGRFGTAGEIAAGILFLASDAASFVTGATLVIDGGALTATY